MFGIQYVIKGIRYGANRCSHLYNSAVKTTRNYLRPKQYQLLEKAEILKKDAPDEFLFAPNKAVRIKHVTVGKRKDKDYYREIVSYYDDYDQIIMRTQSGNNIPRTKRTYTYSSGYTNDNKPVDIREVHTTQYIPAYEGANQGRWAPVCNEQQYVRNNIELSKKKKVVNAKKLHITRTDYSTNGNRNITLTEYPMVYGFEPKSAKKEMKIGLNFKFGEKIPTITDLSGSKNVELPQNDEFLKFRFLVGEEKQEALAKYFLEKKGLANAKVGVGTKKTHDTSNAEFDPEWGWIWFNKIVREPAKTAAHEVEHAWQHSIIGRAFAQTPYEQRCRDIYGPLDTIELQIEAQRLAQAKAIYPSDTRTADGELKPEYLNNYFEVKAREAGEKAKEAYNKGRDFIIKQFKTIPIKDHISI